MNLNQVEESRWLTGGLIAFAAVLTVIALVGAWWAVTDPGAVPSGDTHVLSTQAPEASGPVLAAASAAAGNAPPGQAAAIQPASAQVVPDAIRAVPIPPAPPVTVAGDANAGTLPAGIGATKAAPMMLPLASGVDASAQAAAPMPVTAPPSSAQSPPPDLMQALQPVNPPPAAVSVRSAAPASAAASAPGRAAQVAACDRYAWYQLVQRQQCLWSICNGRWGRDGCPAYQHPSGGH